MTDAATGMAFASTLGEEESFTMADLKRNFIRPVCKTKFTAAAQPDSPSVGIISRKRAGTVPASASDHSSSDLYVFTHADIRFSEV